MIKRSVGLFSGFALLFLGTGVVFYTLKTDSNIEIHSGGLSGTIATASPGLIAMALGVLLLLGTIASKDDFPPYTGEEVSPRKPMIVVPYPADSVR
jgi:hypothetical protein